MREWYVVKTKPRAEQQVGVLLDSRGVRRYLPLVRSPRSLQRMEPLFPGYLFCHLEIPSVQWVEARSLPGIAYVLNTEGRPLPVPERLVESIRERVVMENCAPPQAPFEQGERVMIVRGPFQGLEAAFDRRLSPSGRSRVLVTLLSRLVPVEIHEAELSKAS